MQRTARQELRVSQLAKSKEADTTLQIPESYYPKLELNSPPQPPVSTKTTTLHPPSSRQTFTLTITTLTSNHEANKYSNT